MTLTFYICDSMGFTYIPNMKSLSSLVEKLKAMLNLFFLNSIDFWHWRTTLPLTSHPLKICIFMRYMCKPNMKSLSIMAQRIMAQIVWKLFIGCVKFVNFEFNWLLALKDDLDKSPTQNMHLHEIHVQAKYDVSTCNGTKVMALR